MNSSLDISQISALPEVTPISTFYVYEVSLLNGSVITEGESRVQSAPSMVTIFKSGNAYYYNENKNLGYDYTATENCFLIDRRRNTAVMLWSNEEDYRNEYEDFYNSVCPEEPLIGNAANLPTDALITLEGRNEDEIAGTLHEMFNEEAPNQLEPAATVGFQTISPAKIDSMSLVGDLDSLEGAWFVAFGADGDYWKTGLAKEELEFINTGSDPRNPEFALSADGKTYRCQAVAEGNFAYQIDSDDSCRLFIFDKAEKYREGVFDLAQIFSNEAPSDLFRLAASLQDSGEVVVEEPSSEPEQPTELNNEKKLLSECLVHLTGEGDSNYTREQLIRILSLYQS